MQKFSRSHQPLVSVAEPCLRAATSADRAQLLDFLARLSPTSSYQRFLTGTSRTPSDRVVAALLPQRPAGGARLAFLDGELVGHGLWARLRDPAAAEIAIVVSDEHQRRGIGTALVRAVTEDLVAEGVTDIEVFSSTGNRAVARMVARTAPDARRQLDGSTMTWSFPARGRSPALPRTA
jgi:GNAT superfamily N-acetyltransferase